MRKRKRAKHLSFNIVFIIIFISIIGVGYSYLSGSLRIGGQVSGEMTKDYIVLPDSNSNLKETITLTNSWTQGNKYKYQYNINVKNIGQETINLFILTINFLNDLDSVSISNYEYQINGKTLIITDNNYVLTPNQSIDINFIVTTRTPGQRIESIKFDVPTGGEVPLSKFNVDFSISNGWGHYTYQYNVTLTNKTGNKISGWQLDITLPTGTTFVSGWNGIYSFNNQVLTIENETYNGKINNNSSITIGLQLSTDIINFIPTNIKVIVR